MHRAASVVPSTSGALGERQKGREEGGERVKGEERRKKLRFVWEETGKQKMK